MRKAKIDSFQIVSAFCWALSFLFLTPSLSKAATVSVASCNQTDVQNSINTAQNGDTVLVPGGTCAWTSSVTIPSTKGITLDGNRATVNGQIHLQQNSTTGSRITGFILPRVGSFSVGGTITVGGSKTSAPFRIDHNTFPNSDTQIEISGNAPGLLDHNSFTIPGGNAEIIHNLGMGPSDASGWSDDINPGSPDAVYIEDNTFTNNVSGNPAYFWGASAVQSYYGARTVVRHNTMNMVHVDQHGTPGNIGARWWEIYENTFFVVPNGNQSDYVRVRAGSGVIFNNHKTGSANLGAGTIELVEEDTGYPALYQIGRGKNQVLDPAYVWGNDASMPVGSGSSNVQAGRDYYLTTKLGYTPYTYPHPLQGGTTPPPPLPGDINLDGTVNSLDWSIMNARWGTSDAAADLNHDGIVNSLDFSILNQNWGKTQ